MKGKPVAGDELFHPEVEFLHVHHGGVELHGEGLVVVGGEGEEEGWPDGLHCLAFLQLVGEEVRQGSPRIDNLSSSWNRWKRFSCRVSSHLIAGADEGWDPREDGRQLAPPHDGLPAILQPHLQAQSGEITK